MSGKHDKSGADEQAANLLLTGPIVIRGLGRGVKDALRPGRPSRHRAFVAEAGDDAALSRDDVRPTPLQEMLASGPTVEEAGPSSELSESPVPLDQPLDDPSFPSGDAVAQTGPHDGPGGDRVDDRRADDAPPADAERSQDDDRQDDQHDRTAVAEDEAVPVVDDGLGPEDARPDDVDAAEDAPIAAADEPVIDVGAPADDDAHASSVDTPVPDDEGAGDGDERAPADVVDDFVIESADGTDEPGDGEDAVARELPADEVPSDAAQIDDELGHGEEPASDVVVDDAAGDEHEPEHDQEGAHADGQEAATDERSVDLGPSAADDPERSDDPAAPSVDETAAGAEDGDRTAPEPVRDQEPEFEPEAGDENDSEDQGEHRLQDDPDRIEHVATEAGYDDDEAQAFVEAAEHRAEAEAGGEPQLVVDADGEHDEQDELGPDDVSGDSSEAEAEAEAEAEVEAEHVVRVDDAAESTTDEPADVPIDETAASAENTDAENSDAENSDAEPVFEDERSDEVPADDPPVDEVPADEATDSDRPAGTVLTEDAPVDAEQTDAELLDVEQPDVEQPDAVPTDAAQTDVEQPDETPGDAVPVEDVLVESASVDLQPSEERPVDDALGDDVPVDGMSAGDAAADDVPIEDLSPTDESIADESIDPEAADTEPAALESPDAESAVVGSAEVGSAAVEPIEDDANESGAAEAVAEAGVVDDRPPVAEMDGSEPDGSGAAVDSDTTTDTDPATDTEDQSVVGDAAGDEEILDAEPSPDDVAVAEQRIELLAATESAEDGDTEPAAEAHEPESWEHEQEPGSGAPDAEQIEVVGVDFFEAGVIDEPTAAPADEPIEPTSEAAPEDEPEPEPEDEPEPEPEDEPEPEPEPEPAPATEAPADASQLREGGGDQHEESVEPTEEPASASPADVIPAAVTASAAGPARAAAPRAPRPTATKPARPPRRPRPVRERVGREAIGIAVLVVLALICGGLITAVVLKTQRDAAIASQEAANYTPPPLATPEPTATGPVVAVIGDGTTSVAASGVTNAQKWSGLLGSALSGTVSTDASNGMGYASKGNSGETFVQAAAKVPSNADVVVFFGGASDATVPPLSLAKAATDAYTAAKKQAPDAKLVVVGPVITQGMNAVDLTAIRNSLRSTAGIAKATWIDPIDANWLTAAQQSASSPNALTAAEEKTIAAKMQAVVKKALG